YSNPLPALLSFPTRRSSDLPLHERGEGPAAPRGIKSNCAASRRTAGETGPAHGGHRTGLASALPGEADPASPRKCADEKRHACQGQGLIGPTTASASRLPSRWTRRSGKSDEAPARHQLPSPRDPAGPVSRGEPSRPARGRLGRVVRPRADVRRARADAGPRRARRHARDALAPASGPPVRVGHAVRPRWHGAAALPDLLYGVELPDNPGRSAREPPRDAARPGPPATRIG